MAGNEMYAHGAGVSEGKTGSIEELTEEQIKEIAKEDMASWHMPPSGLYLFTVYKISEKVEAISKGGKQYTYRQVLGIAHGRSGNLLYDGEVLIRVIGTQAEIFKRIAESDSKKCLIDIRKWNDMPRISGVYGIDYLIQLLKEDGSKTEFEQIREVIH